MVLARIGIRFVCSVIGSVTNDLRRFIVGESVGKT